MDTPDVGVGLTSLPEPDVLAAQLQELFATIGREKHALLQLLVALQSRYNCIPPRAVDDLALTLGLTRAEIDGVIDFYAFLHSSARGAYDILFSDNVIDQMQGSRARAAELSAAIGCPVGGSGANASIAFTSCTGLSDQGPGILVNGRAIGGVDRSRIQRMAEHIRLGVPVSNWPRSWFDIDSNIRRRDAALSCGLPRGEALAAVLARDPDEFISLLNHSRLRGRGGAGFSTARKWALCRKSPGEHVVVCNADEGEPGTFKDRVLLQTEAHTVIEGMTLCAAVVGARSGLIYLRGEYRFLLEHLESVLAQRRESGLLGENILGHEGFDFDIRIHLGAGAYICGEESALIESLEGKRGIPRIRPPFPVEVGYLGQPTVVNNVETFFLAALIAEHGSAWFRSQGTDFSGGTKLLSVSGDCDAPGIYEFPLGTPVREILDDCGARNTALVQVGGAAGETLAPQEFGRRIAFDDVPTGGSFMIFNDSRAVLDIVANFNEFFVHESCGFCTPCRVGNVLLKQRLTKIASGRGGQSDLEKMREIGRIMQHASHCGLGATAANPILDTLDRFPEAYRAALHSNDETPAFDLDDALAPARLLTGRDDAAAHLDDA